MSASEPDAFNIGLKYPDDVAVAQEERLSLGQANPTVKAHALTKRLTTSRSRLQLQRLELSRGSQLPVLTLEGYPARELAATKVATSGGALWFETLGVWM